MAVGDRRLHEGYLCEGNVFENYGFLDGQHFHFYHQLTEEGRIMKTLQVEYSRAVGAWYLEDSVGRKEISEEEAMEIVAGFPRIELDMSPVKDFPMN